MRPRRAVPLTPSSPTPALPQNVAKSCVCHTSENSPVTPIIATDPKTRSRKSCVCHTCDPLPPPPFHLLLLFLLSPRVTRHFQVPALVVANLPLYFQAVAACSPRNPFLFMLLHGCRGVVGGKHRRPAPVRSMFSFKNPCTVSPPSFPASGAAAHGDSRISHQSPVTNHQALPWSCWDSPVRLELSAVNCQLSTRLTPVECAVPKKGGVRGVVLWPQMPSFGDRGSVRAAASPFRGLNQGAQGRIHRFLVGKVRRDIRRKQHQIRSSSITCVILAPDSAFQLRQVVFRPQAVTPLTFLSLFLHIVFVREASSCGR